MMSRKYNEDIEIYKKQFKENFSKIFAIAFLGSVIVVFYFKEIITLLIGTKYTPSFPLIPFYVFSFLLYSLINLIGASVNLPALMLKEAIYCQLILCVSSILVILLFSIFGFGTMGVGIGMLLGVSLALSYQLCAIYRTLKFNIFDTKFLILILSLIPMFSIYMFVSNWIEKTITFLISLILYLLLLRKLKILNLQDFVLEIVRGVKFYENKRKVSSS